jgi:hypothetical protein
MFAQKILAGRIKTEDNIVNIRIRTNEFKAKITIKRMTSSESYENQTIDESSFYVVDSNKTIKYIEISFEDPMLDEFLNLLATQDNLFDMDGFNPEEGGGGGGGAAASSATHPTSPPPADAPPLSLHHSDEDEDDEVPYNPSTDTWINSFGGDDIRTKYHHHISTVLYMCVIGAVSTIL